MLSSSHRKARQVINFLALVAGTYLLIVVLLFIFQRNMIYFPSSGHLSPSEWGLSGIEVVELETDDGLPLVAWWRPPRDNKASLIYFHGNAGHIGHRAGKVTPYLDAGFGVLLVEYRGYGSNPGYPTELGFYLDAEAAMSFLRARDVPLYRTVLYGESLGTGVAIEMAARYPVAGLVLEAPFSSIPDVAQGRMPFIPARWLVRDRFDSVSKVSKSQAPVLIIHGERDRVIPIKFAKRLFETIAEEKRIIIRPHAGHNDLYEFNVVPEIIDFIDSFSGDVNSLPSGQSTE